MRGTARDNGWQKLRAAPRDVGPPRGERASPQRQCLHAGQGRSDNFTANDSGSQDRFLGAQVEANEEVGIHAHVHQYRGNAFATQGYPGEKPAPTPERMLSSSEEEELDNALLLRADIETLAGNGACPH